MRAKDARIVSQLCEAIDDIPRVRRRLSDKPGEFHDAIHLELAAADMVDGVGQGSSAYVYLPPKVGRAILDEAEKIIRKELRRLGVMIQEKERSDG